LSGLSRRRRRRRRLVVVFVADDRASGTANAVKTTRIGPPGGGRKLHFTRQSKCPSRSATIRAEYTHTHARAHAGVELIYLRAGGISRGRSLTRARDTRAERRALIRNSNSGAICNGMKYASLFRKRSAEIIRGRDSTDPDEIKGTRETQAAEIRRAALPSARQLVLNTLSVETIRQGISMFPFRRISGRNLPSQLHSLAILISARNGARQNARGMIHQIRRVSLIIKLNLR